MGNVLVNSNGDAIISGNKAFEVTASVDSNIVAGNIKKDVIILGVTGTYEGSGGGGFRCTNKLCGTVNNKIDTYFSHQYTFDGTLAEVGLAVFAPSDDCSLAVAVQGSSYQINFQLFVAPETLVFQDKFCYPNYNVSERSVVVMSPTLHFMDISGSHGRDLDANLAIDSQGLMIFTPESSQIDIYGKAHILVVFKGSDGTYDYDVVQLVLYGDD